MVDDLEVGSATLKARAYSEPVQGGPKPAARRAAGLSAALKVRRRTTGQKLGRLRRSASVLGGQSGRKQTIGGAIEIVPAAVVRAVVRGSVPCRV